MINLKRFTKKETLDNMLGPSQVRTMLMMLLSGIHPQNALQSALEMTYSATLKNDTSHGVFRLLSSLKYGAGLENAVYKNFIYLRSQTDKQILRRLLVYERTGSEIVLLQLEEDLRQIHKEKMNHLIEEIERADLAAMLPNMILLVILLILLTLPMLLGGMFI